MNNWYKNIVTVIAVLIAALILEALKKMKLKSMFEINDIKNDVPSIGSVLLVIAHPDDEIMFWTPTIKTLLGYNIPMKILCLSNGNYDGLGELREKEFDDVSRALNLSDNQILNIPELQDNITQKWEPSIVSQQIEEFLKTNQDVKTILTFDENGVTKHPNHISCYDGVKYYLKTHLAECKKKNLKVFILDSFNFVLQYTSIIPLFNALIKRQAFYLMSFFNSYKYMRYYKTQFNLLRKAHVILSGYSYFNSYTKLDY
jgi:N-acetylglucosaminylphosphatidylinositol deacetylase